jgi:hypothetical protein
MIWCRLGVESSPPPPMGCNCVRLASSSAYYVGYRGGTFPLLGRGQQPHSQYPVVLGRMAGRVSSVEVASPRDVCAHFCCRRKKRISRQCPTYTTTAAMLNLDSMSHCFPPAETNYSTVSPTTTIAAQHRPETNPQKQRRMKD